MDVNFCILQKYCKGLIDPFGHISERIYETYSKDRKNSLLNRLIFFLLRVLKHFHIIQDSLWLYNFNKKWINDIEKYDLFIIFLDSNSRIVEKVIKKHNPRAKCLLYSWDIGHSCKYLIEEGKLNCGSFDLFTAANEKVPYYGQFFNNMELLPQNELKYDYFFIGLDKGRRKIVELIDSTMRKEGYNGFSRIVYDDYRNGMEYLTILKMVTESKCLIDVPVDNQTGYTLRVMESMFYGKKLITTNVEIVNADFYDSNNIYVWGQDERSIKDFMDLPFCPYSDKIRYEYSLEGWINRNIQFAD